ncbi:MAG TPA: hypothetical protein VN736_27805 [Candidatus Limnocylindrales bacterium]|nr:hypothetical protein [Candidatus Limnocylindrales bacterium]
MNCAEAEILICDYATLSPAERSELDRHLYECAACAELARDSAAALAFMERAELVEPPPELITRILFDAPWTKQKPETRAGKWFRALLSPILQPRFAMGFALTVISISFLVQSAVPHQLKPSDLEPAKVWNALTLKVDLAWARTVKFYENLKFVYQVQTMLREWQQQSEEQVPAGGAKPQGGATDERKLPVKPPASQTSGESGAPR